jgi:hypothetical protein
VVPSEVPSSADQAPTVAMSAATNGVSSGFPAKATSNLVPSEASGKRPARPPWHMIGSPTDPETRDPPGNRDAGKQEAREPPSERDTLDELVRAAMATLQAASSWEDSVGEIKAPDGYLHPDVGQLSYRVAHLLDRFPVPGAPVRALGEAIEARCHAILKYFRWLAQDLANRSMRLAELVLVDTPSTLGAHNALALGMDGVHFVPLEDGTVEPLM